jgi:hypothetical protein
LNKSTTKQFHDLQNQFAQSYGLYGRDILENTQAYHVRNGKDNNRPYE